MSLYLWVNLLSISVPFLVSFHPRSKLYKDWNSLFFATLISLTPYVIWDIIFTEKAFWGFNDVYLSGHFLFGLPMEEWLFFICIPYACVFMHYALLELYDKFVLSEKLTKYLSYFLFIAFSIVLIFTLDKAYTSIDMIFAIIVLFVAYKFNFRLLQRFYITFLFMLVPFLIVNGVLTGTGIEGEIVWYNDMENLGIRILTIPIEDAVYAFSLLLLNLFLFEYFKKLFAKNKQVVLAH